MKKLDDNQKYIIRDMLQEIVDFMDGNVNEQHLSIAVIFNTNELMRLNMEINLDEQIKSDFKGETEDPRQFDRDQDQRQASDRLDELTARLAAIDDDEVTIGDEYPSRGFGISPLTGMRIQTYADGSWTNDVRQLGERVGGSLRETASRYRGMGD